MKYEDAWPPSALQLARQGLTRNEWRPSIRAVFARAKKLTDEGKQYVPGFGELDSARPLIWVRYLTPYAAGYRITDAGRQAYAALDIHP